MRRARSVAPAEEHEESYAEIDHADCVLIVERRRFPGFTDHYRDRHLDALTDDMVSRLLQHSDLPNGTGGVLGVIDSPAVDRNQEIAFFDPPLLARTAGSDVRSDWPLLVEG